MHPDVNPYAAPHTTPDLEAGTRQSLDRRGVVRRLSQIVSISCFGAVLGNVLGKVFFPSLNSDSGYSFLIIVLPVVGLIVWFLRQLKTMPRTLQSRRHCPSDELRGIAPRHENSMSS